MDMIQGATPPTVASLIAFDSDWKGQRHYNLCVVLHNGAAVVHVGGAPDYRPYYVPPTTTLFRETPGSIAIDTPDDPHNHGTVCLGVAGI